MRYVSLFLILTCSFLMPSAMPSAQAAVKDVIYSGQEIEFNTNKDHKTTAIFPEAIKGIVRGYGADPKDYLIIRNDLDPKVLEVMPLTSELAEITAIGISGEQYVLKMLYKEDFHTKVTIVPLKKAMGDVETVVKELKIRPSELVKKSELGLAVNNDVARTPAAFIQKSMPPSDVVSQGAESKLSTPTAPSEPAMPALPAELNMKITLKGNGLPLKIYLGAIGKATGYNVISTPEVDAKKASINLEDIEVWRALKSLLYPFAYGFKVSKEDLIISTNETRTFAIAVPAVEQTFSDVTSNESFTNQASGVNNTTSARGATDQDVKVGTKIYLENKSPTLSLWNDLENNIKSMITPTTGQYSLNRVAGMVVVTDLPGVLDRIQDFIDRMNTSLKRQAAFEIQIIEVALTDERQLGIDWNALASSIGGLKNITGSTNFSSAGFTGGQLLTLSGSSSNSTTNNVSAVIKALETMGRVEIVSRPSITVSNMIPAVIQEGTSIGYISGIGDTFSNNVTTSNVTTSQVHGGLTMRLVAKIGENGADTILNLSTAVTTIDSIDSIKSGNGVVQTPQVSNKSITTNVAVAEGKTLIIGGLISTNKADTHSGVPVISRLPVVGGAFKYTNKKCNKVELVIVITPRTGDKN